MGKLFKLILLILIIGIGLLAWSHAPIKLEVTANRDLPAELPAAQPPAAMQISVIATGQMQAGQAFAYRGGSFMEENISAMDVVLVQHPGGDLLIDTGFGRDVDAHFATTPWLMQNLASYEPHAPAALQLSDDGYDLNELQGILLTHAHWDHVSGVPDFPDTPVWISQAESGFINSGAEPAHLAHSFAETVDYQTYSFDDGPYMGYPRSHDVYKDGSIVLVPMPGHTPGSAGIFVTLPSGKRFFFVGDLVWVREGYERPAERPFMARYIIAEDAAAVREEIVHVHRLHKKFPALHIVPAHDRRQFAAIAGFPDSTR